MYKMLLDERATLTVDRAAFIIGEYPPILITTEEELKMSKLGFQHGGEPEKRYAHVPISGFSLKSDGTAHKPPKKKKSSPKLKDKPKDDSPKQADDTAKP